MAVNVKPLTRSPDLVRRRLMGHRFDAAGFLFRLMLLVALFVTLGVLVVLLVDVVSGGWGVLTTRLGDFLSGRLGISATRSGISQGLRGTFFIGMFVVLIAFPLGVGAAIYLEEYAPHSRFSRFIDVNIRNLAGVPSVVYGLLGFAIFVKALRFLTGPEANGATVISAGLTLSVLVLPIVIITSAEAIRAVPGNLREAGFGVGATRWEVVRAHVLPYAGPGILTGTVLALARALGEAAPLILVGATTGFLTEGDSYSLGSLRERFTAMPIVIYTWAGRPQAGFRSATAAAIVVLLVVVLLANTVAILLRNKYEKRR
ncbi:MAG TPA: phosphate ABC transporter permease PstA [Actinomycetota bacterium]|nr:phosphate ABC transporter permease PstA [Actinomycetota bacterium]